uniref:Orphan protein n=1 Tax=Rheinheimera sp. BAL341 TaxID=1708203 RepID=A0A486XVA0_9GAMM
MKLLTVTVLSSLALLSANSQASNNNYVYSNTEYCQLAGGNITAAHLDAYSRKLGFTPTAQECRTLTAATAENNATAVQQDVRKLLKEALKGSALRPSAALSHKLQAMSEQERELALQNLWG